MSLELAHIAHGDGGPPVVILHGLLGSARNWSTLAKQLGATHRVLALDLRNHGASPWADVMTYEQMALDVRAFLDRQQVPAAGVIGHSMGGKVAMRLALAHPERVARLVVVDIAPVAYRRGFNAHVEAMRSIDLGTIGRRSEADGRLAAVIPEPAVRSFLLQNLVSGDEGFRWRVNLDALAAEMDAIMGFPPAPASDSYRGPTLFVAGGRSDYVREEHRPAILQLFPRAQFATIERAGHWVHAEAPDAFLRIVRDFLD